MDKRTRLEALAWIKDCIWGDVEDPDEFDDYTDAELIRGINRNFDGGWPAFLLSIQMEE